MCHLSIPLESQVLTHASLALVSYDPLKDPYISYTFNNEKRILTSILEVRFHNKVLVFYKQMSMRYSKWNFHFHNQCQEQLTFNILISMIFFLSFSKDGFNLTTLQSQMAISLVKTFMYKQYLFQMAFWCMKFFIINFSWIRKYLIYLIPLSHDLLPFSLLIPKYIQCIPNAIALMLLDSGRSVTLLLACVWLPGIIPTEAGIQTITKLAGQLSQEYESFFRPLNF